MNSKNNLEKTQNKSKKTYERRLGLIHRRAKGNSKGSVQRKPLRRESVTFSKDLYKRFKEFSMMQSFNRIKQMFINMRGRHEAINYRQQYNFKEQWQISKSQNQIDKQKVNIIYGFYALIFIISSQLFMWGISINLIVVNQQRFSWIHNALLILNLLEIVKIIGFEVRKTKTFRLLSVIKKNLEDVILFLCSLIVVIFAIDNHKARSIQFFFVSLIIFLLYRKFLHRYQDLKIFHISTKYRDYVKLLDLFILLISISHIFALGLYAIANTQDTNWMTKVPNLIYSDWTTKYIYSIYFSCTTLLTVGYGDLSPTNVGEILVILFIELIGIVTFGYAVNQIGGAISSLQEKKQKMEKDLNLVQNIGKSYNLDTEIVYRMRKQLINNKSEGNAQNLAEEKQLLNFFSDDLRSNIQIMSSMKIIKRSMFMISQWTGRFQAKVAQKLLKEIYTAEQTLSMLPGKEKLYIVDQGKIHIKNDGRKGCFQQILKTIKVGKGEDFKIENVYGYSSIISNKRIHLNALCKETSSCYTIKKSEIHDILRECEEDLQHFHELKDSINIAKIPQQFQAPSIINIREHYQPSTQFTIYTHNSKINKVFNDSVSNYGRSNFKTKLFIKSDDQEQNIGSYHEQRNMTLLNLTQQRLIYQNTEQFGEKQEEDILGFQSCKEFQRYFRKKNYEMVIKRLSVKNYAHL